MVIPGLPGYRAKGFCSQLEADANNIAAMIFDYLDAPENLGKLPTQIDIEQLVDVKNPWKLTICGENFYIHVIDRNRKCPVEYQNADANWDANIYTLKF